MIRFIPLITFPSNLCARALWATWLVPAAQRVLHMRGSNEPPSHVRLCKFDWCLKWFENNRLATVAVGIQSCQTLAASANRGTGSVYVPIRIMVERLVSVDVWTIQTPSPTACRSKDTVCVKGGLSTRLPYHTSRSTWGWRQAETGMVLRNDAWRLISMSVQDIAPNKADPGSAPLSQSWINKCILLSPRCDNLPWRRQL